MRSFINPIGILFVALLLITALNLEAQENEPNTQEPKAQESGEIAGLFNEVEKGIKVWDIEGASKAAEQARNIAVSEADRARADYYSAIVEFHRGNYTTAGEYAGKALSSEAFDLDKGFINFISKVGETSPKFEEYKTDNFIIRYADPRDRILAEYGKDVLEKSRYEIGLDLKTYPEEPVIVEIYPDMESFTLASTLSSSSVKTTGVVGICKFNRIMILSPRLLPRGYTWSDTLAHEYVHYLVFLKSGNTVPVWLHEGIAKFQEKRWKEKKANVLSPFYETMLASALEKDELVPIEKMHPSLAMLDSAAEAQLAFAQAGTTISYLVDNWGGDALVELILQIKETNDYKVAISKVTGMDFDTFYQSWKDDLHSKELQEKITDLKVKGVRISNNQEETDDDSEDLVDIDDKRARDHTRLGDLLRIRGRVRSSAYEYEKALRYDPASPIITSRLASSLTSSGKADKAREVIDPVLEIYPDYIGLHMILGKIYMEKGNLSKAEEAFKTAIAINPFDPVIHDSLIYIYEEQGKKESAEREREILNILLQRETANEQPNTE